MGDTRCSVSYQSSMQNRSVTDLGLFITWLVYINIAVSWISVWVPSSGWN